jgi:hypothetical protein
MSTIPDPAGPRSSVTVSKLRDGQHTWKLTVVATASDGAALRAAVTLAREIDGELTLAYEGEPDAASRVRVPPRLDHDAGDEATR